MHIVNATREWAFIWVWKHVKELGWVCQHKIAQNLWPRKKFQTFCWTMKVVRSHFEYTFSFWYLQMRILTSPWLWLVANSFADRIHWATMLKILTLFGTCTPRWMCSRTLTGFAVQHGVTRRLFGQLSLRCSRLGWAGYKIMQLFRGFDASLQIKKDISHCSFQACINPFLNHFAMPSQDEGRISKFPVQS